MVVAIVVGAEWGAVGVAAGASAGLFFAWLFNAVFAMRSSGVAVRPLLMISVRPVMLFAPVTVMGLVVSASLGHQNSVMQAATILAVAALYLGSAALLPAVRKDLGVLLDTARRVRSL
jgi:PST family polysaccharide transporter